MCLDWDVCLADVLLYQRYQHIDNVGDNAVSQNLLVKVLPKGILDTAWNTVCLQSTSVISECTIMDLSVPQASHFQTSYD